MTQEKKRLLVYRASAGSGKTFTLAARYIALLLNGDPFSSILAVTFTNKATAEMKQRIINYLYKISTGDIEDDFMKKVDEFRTNKTPNENVQAKAQTILYRILNDYDHFAVMTIDSFLQILLAGLARRLHLKANSEVDLDQDARINEAVDKLMSNINGEEQGVRSKLTSFIDERIAEDKPWDVRRDIKALCKELGKEPFLINEKEICADVDDDAKIKQYKKELHEKTNAREKSIREILGVKLNEYDAKFDRPYLKRQGDLDKSLAHVSNLVAHPDAEFKNIADKQREQINDIEKWTKRCLDSADVATSRKLLLEIIEKMDEYEAIENSVKLSEQHLYELCLLSRVQEIINDLEQERDSTLITTTPITLKREMQSGDAPFILEKAGIRYKHIMIDEFQDTSHLQWDLFKPLLEEVMSKDGTVLLVGDVKQSIYRWRNGDWEMLNNISGEDQLGRYFAEDSAEIVPQVRNFRTRKNVVQFNLNLFKYLSKELDDEEKTITTIYDEKVDENPIEEYYDPKKRLGGYVQVRLYPEISQRKSQEGSEDENKMNLADKMVENMFDQIVELVDKGVPMTDITLLVRTHKQAQTIANFLTQRRQQDNRGKYDKLSVVSSEAFLLSSSTSVKILMNALRYLVTKNGISLYYLLYRYQTEVLGNNISWEDIRKHAKPGQNNENTIQELLPEGYLDKNLLDLPLYELMERLARMFLYNKEGKRLLKDDSFVFRLMDGITTFMQGTKTEPKEFLEYWDETLCNKAINGSPDGITILTIHKAKGLENKNVFIPFCDWSIISDMLNKNCLWCKPKEEPFNTNMTMLPIQAVSKMEKSIYSEDYQKEIFMQTVDCLNNLYVALTRAANNLFISGKITFDKDGNNKHSSIMDYIKDYIHNELGQESFSNEQLVSIAGESEYAEYANGEIVLPTEEKKEKVENSKQAKKEGKSKVKPEVIELQYRNLKERFTFRQSTDSYSFLFPDDKQYDTTAAKHGQLLHLIYSAIEKVEDTGNVIDFCCKQGTIENEEQAEEIRKVITNSWTNAQAASWFDGSWKLFRECGILEKNEKGELVKHRPDRVIEKDGTTIVIDFKFAKKDKEHEDQVRRYMRLMKEMGKENVQGYLWYINDNKTEIKLVTL